MVAARPRRARRNRFAMAGINITPLIDILLVLLVIFMVITPNTPTGLEASVPQPPPPGPQPVRNEVLVLSLDGAGKLTLNQEPIATETLIPRLQDVLRTRSDRTVFIRAGNELLYNEVAKLIDATRGAGASKVGLLTGEQKFD